MINYNAALITMVKLYNFNLSIILFNKNVVMYPPMRLNTKNRKNSTTVINPLRIFIIIPVPLIHNYLK